MSNYFITSSSGIIYQLDSTFMLSVSRKATLTSYKVEDGSTLSDHYKKYPLVFNLRGVISDVKRLQSPSDRVKSTDEFISGVDSLIDSNTEFSFTWRDDKRRGITYTTKNCLITNFDITQDASSPASSVGYSYQINLTIEQVRFSDRATVEVVKADFLANKTADKTSGRGGSSEVEDESDKKTELPTYSIDVDFSKPSFKL